MKTVTRNIDLSSLGVHICPIESIGDTMRNDRENLIVELTIEFTLMVIDFSERLEEIRKFVVARQLLRAGASIGSNTWEAQNAESKADFTHKFKVAAKEADETTYWLTVCQRAKSYPDPDPELMTSLQSIKRIISKIISSSKGR